MNTLQTAQSGSLHSACSPLSAWFATWHYEAKPPFLPDDDQVTIPPIACGRGYRQLRWREDILPTDEYFGGTKSKPRWIPMGPTDRKYRPRTANSAYAPWSIIRRRENTERSAPAATEE